jgi:hypothetical protein
VAAGISGQTLERKGLKPHFWIRTLFRIRVIGQEHLPVGGPALLVRERMSPVERFLMGASIFRFIRFMVYRPDDETPFGNPLLRLAKAIPAGTGKEAIGAVGRARAQLQSGQIVCISAESGISRTGDLLPFNHGIECTVEGLDVPIIPVCVHRAAASARVTVAFGPALPGWGLTAHAARLAIRELHVRTLGIAGVDAKKLREPVGLLPVVVTKVVHPKTGEPLPADAEALTFERT